MSDAIKCASICGGKNDTVVRFEYFISRGPQSVPQCRDCAKEWQKKFGHTPAGQSLTIRAIADV